MQILSQRTLPWANEKLGSSIYYIHAYGSSITCLAEIMETTPDFVNEKLKEHDGFDLDEQGQPTIVKWKKIEEIFPGYSAQAFSPYNNEVVKESLAEGNEVIVECSGAPLGTPNPYHYVRYIGNGECHDPWTGSVRSTSDFPDVKSYTIITKPNKKGGETMAKLFKVTVQTAASREVNVSAETAEEAQAKVELAEGEVVSNVEGGEELVV